MHGSRDVIYLWMPTLSILVPAIKTQSLLAAIPAVLPILYGILTATAEL